MICEIMKLQLPRGMRDFYPQPMAWRNYILDAWRRVSIRHGFEQVDGPIFEMLDLYKVKSGEGIVSELFHFQDRGGRDFAIRPEFTPTLARMVAQKASSLPKPIKWFAIPNFCRAERPQRGRLREFWQWNVDILGSDEAVADAECILVAVDLMRELGLRPEHVRVKISHRKTVRRILEKMGVAEDKIVDAFNLLDRREKVSAEEFRQAAGQLGLDKNKVDRFDQICRMKFPVGGLQQIHEHLGLDQELDDLRHLDKALEDFSLANWCEYDLGIVRGLAYYTGTVFEIHEVTGVERALAGGGRYDKLIELFGGPKTSAVGFGMGDVVLTDVLEDKGLVPESVMPRPDVFVIGASDSAYNRAVGVVGLLRQNGIHARFSYKQTRNLGKLLKEAASSGSRYALILDDHTAPDNGTLKNMETGAQREIALSEVKNNLRELAF